MICTILEKLTKKFEGTEYGFVNDTLTVKQTNKYITVRFVYKDKSYSSIINIEDDITDFDKMVEELFTPIIKRIDYEDKNNDTSN